MNEHEHHELRVSLGAYVLGGLPSQEVQQVEAHLATCAECRAELDQLRPMASALSDVRRAGGVQHHAEVPADLGDQVVGAVDLERRRESRSRWTRHASIAGVAAASAAAVLVAGLALTRSDEPAKPPMEAVPVSVSDARVTAGADLVNHTWGVEVKLRAKGFDRGGRYQVVVLGRDGKQYPAGEFVGTGDKEMVCNLNSSVIRDRANGFEVRNTAGSVVVRSAFT